MKKFLSLVLALAMMVSVCAFANAEGFNGEIKVWVAEAVVDFTNQQVEAFKAAHPEYAGFIVTVQAVGEGDAASNMITDVEGGADIFGFAQDQLARLVAAGALEVVEEENAKVVEAENDAGSVAAVKMGDVMYAYPMTSDNGYFLYYDKSVVTDPSDLDKILADCEKAGKSFYMEINSGWYQTAFFFGAGCSLTYDTDAEGNLVAMNCDYASENGVKALKSMIKLAKSPAFVNGSSASNATNLGAIVDGTWDSNAVKEMLGDNFAAAKLPVVDGYQLAKDGESGMANFGGEFSGFDAETADEKTLRVTATRADGSKLVLNFREDAIDIDFGLTSEAAFRTAELKFRGSGPFFEKLDFPPGKVVMEFEGVTYSVSYEGDLKPSLKGWTLHPIRGKAQLSFK